MRLVAATAALVVAASLQADDGWPRFRGPNGSGVSEVSFPAKWTEDDLAWKISLPGTGHSSPVAWGERVFVTAGDEASAEITLLAIDAATGETLWSKPFASTAHHLHDFNSYASSTPALDAGRVFVTWASPSSLQAAALTRAGEELWRRNLGEVQYQHGFGGSPIVLGETVIIASDNSGASFITALDAATGEPRWRRERKPGTESYATPAVWRDERGEPQIILASTTEGIAAVSPRDGSSLWQLPEVFPARCVNSPVVAGGLIFCGSGEGGGGKSFAAVRPPSGPGDEASVAYELRQGLPQVVTSIAHDGLLFIWSDRGVVSCHDLAGGKQHWSERVGGNYFSSPIIAGGVLYGVAADGEVVALAADKHYKLLGRSQLGEPSHATPAVHRDRMLLRTESSLASLPASE